MKVAELLSIPQFADMSIIAGETGINREIHTVNMMDAPDIIHFLHRDEWLVTTAFHLKDHPKLLVELIRAMAEKGCAALGIKTKRFLHEIPKEALLLADELQFPILELPLERSLGEIVNHALRAILNNRETELANALEIHRQFTEIIMKGNGIKQLLRVLSKQISRPVLLYDQYFKPIYTSQRQWAVHLNFNHLSFATSDMAYITFSDIVSKQTYSLFPIQMSEKKIGSLLIMGEIYQSDHFTRLIIDQAMNVISFALMKEYALKQRDRSIRNDFFLHFIDGAFSTTEEIINRAMEFSIINEKKYICCVGKIDDDGNFYTYSQRQEYADEVFRFLEEHLESYSPNIYLFSKSELCILLYKIEDHSINTNLYIEDSLKKIQKLVFDSFQHTISFGVSNLCHKFLHVKTAYKEAVDALSQGQLSKQAEFIYTYSTRNITELLRLIPQDNLKNFYTYVLKEFSTKNDEEKQNLLNTLFVYLETNCQISETAKRLYVHRNTVIYRIEKCEEILGKNFKDPETSLQLRLALRIKSIFEGE